MKIRVGVIFGGCSVEHEVSIISALQAIENINYDKYEVVPIYISKDKYWYTGNTLLNISNYKDIEGLLKKCHKVTLIKNNDEYQLITNKGLFNKAIDKIDIAFPIVHGQNVEDGTLAGYLDTIGIPYVGSNVLGSSIGQDKVIIKDILKSNNINVVDYIWFYDKEYLTDKDNILKRIKSLGYPVIVKPASLGSSIGINYVKNDKVIEDAILEAIDYDKKIIVEKCIDNLIEVNCSVLGNYEYSTASVIEEVVSNNNILTYSDKYVGGNKSKGKIEGIVNTSRIIPANISDDLSNKIKDISKKVFRLLNFSGVVRIDYLINSKTNEFYVNEPNTIPGSLSFYLWDKCDKPYKDLLDDLITISIKEYKEKQKKNYSFNTNILKNFNGIKGIKK